MKVINKRNIWARGLTKLDIGKTIELPDMGTVLLRGVEHFGDRSVLTVVSAVDIEHDQSVVVNDV